MKIGNLVRRRRTKWDGNITHPPMQGLVLSMHSGEDTTKKTRRFWNIMNEHGKVMIISEAYLEIINESR